MTEEDLRALDKHYSDDSIPKPIRKFNNGNSALLCNTCRKIIATGDDALYGYKLYCDEHFANQRGIEELEEIKIRLSKKSFSEHCVEEVDNRIKELKQ